MVFLNFESSNALTNVLFFELYITVTLLLSVLLFITVVAKTENHFTTKG